MLLAFVVVAALSLEDGDGVLRSELKAWNAGPGKELGRTIAKKKTAELRMALSTAQKGKVNSKVGAEPKLVTINGKKSLFFPDTKTKNESIAQLKKELLEAGNAENNPKPSYPTVHPSRLRVGVLGRLAYAVEGGPRALGDGLDGDFVVTVLQVVDEKNAIVALGSKQARDPQWVWLTMATTGMVDDEEYVLGDKVVEVIGTKQYATAGGSAKTVLHLVLRTPEELATP